MRGNSRRHLSRQFSVRQQVLVRDPNKRRGKLDARFLGLYEVLSREGDIYQIRDIDNGDFLTRHAESLKPFSQPRSQHQQVEGCDLTMILCLLLVIGVQSIVGFFREETSPVAWHKASNRVVFG